ncbi:MAG: hypothetical protein COA78_08515 [Blastopirellula sp.]|nr:MAG: hypothetical protein COA78_08515 [Blastopirellula sp.]
MKKFIQAVVAFSLLVGLSTVAQAETTVTLGKMHICCGKCVRGIEAAVKDLTGVKATIDAKKGTTVLSAVSDEAAQKAVDALAKAGYHATSDSKEIKMKNDSGVKKGKVTRLELTGIHNCCRKCNTAITKALASVDGIEANNAKPNSDTLVVEGNFEGTALIKALFAAGFHGKVK